MWMYAETFLRPHIRYRHICSLYRLHTPISPTGLLNHRVFPTEWSVHRLECVDPWTCFQMSALESVVTLPGLTGPVTVLTVWSPFLVSRAL